MTGSEARSDNYRPGFKIDRTITADRFNPDPVIRNLDIPYEGL